MMCSSLTGGSLDDWNITKKRCMQQLISIQMYEKLKKLFAAFSEGETHLSI